MNFVNLLVNTHNLIAAICLQNSVHDCSLKYEYYGTTGSYLGRFKRQHRNYSMILFCANFRGKNNSVL